jgi:hypothetical protein
MTTLYYGTHYELNLILIQWLDEEDWINQCTYDI